MSIKKFLLKMYNVELDYGRDIIIKWTRKICSEFKEKDKIIKVLDLGCGTGTDISNIQSVLTNFSFDFHGIETYEPNVKAAQAKNIKVFSLDIERNSFPFSDDSFDIVICNQVIEHLKEFYWVFSESSRILKKNGAMIIGIPNLAALHNRLYLLVGKQPVCIELTGHHIRGITKQSFVKFIENKAFFKVEEFAGSNFYFPKPISSILSQILPTLSTSIFFLLRRTEKPGTFLEVLNNGFFETVFFGKHLPDN